MLSSGHTFLKAPSAQEPRERCGHTDWVYFSVERVPVTVSSGHQRSGIWCVGAWTQVREPWTLVVSQHGSSPSSVESYRAVVPTLEQI